MPKPAASDRRAPADRKAWCAINSWKAAEQQAIVYGKKKERSLCSSLDYRVFKPVLSTLACEV